MNGHVSWERVCSGPGLKNIYTFLRDCKKMNESAELRQRMQEEDPNAVIGELGESGSDELCTKALDVFVSIYGSEAGNLALKILGARRDVYRRRDRAEDSEKDAGWHIHARILRQGPHARFSFHHAGAHHSGKSRGVDGGCFLR